MEPVILKRLRMRSPHLAEQQRLARWDPHCLLAAMIACLLWALCGAGLPVVADNRADHACLSQCHGQLEHQVEIHGKFSEYVDVAQLRSSIHGRLSCLDCHQDITKVPHDENIAPVDCVSCHYKGNPRQAPYGNESRDYVESVHAQVEQDGKKKPRCADCHGGHDILPPQDTQSRVYKMHVPETCGQCHKVIYEEYTLSIHGKALLWDRALDAPSCVDCHGVHRILSHKDPESRVHPTHVSRTCSGCHEAVEVVGKYGISTKRVGSYEESYHGLANKYGVQATANCASCHGIHNILASTDPASSIHADNLARTCGQKQCHPQAVEGFTLGPVHLGIVEAPYDITRWIKVGYTLLIVLVIGGMIVHNGLDYIRTRQRRKHDAH